MDLTTLTDAELGQLQLDVSTEQRHRDALSGIPIQIAELAAQFRAGGGTEAALQDALTPEQIAALESA